jgi:GT2 family glycosyltransferase
MVSGQEAIHVLIPTWRGRDHLATLLPSLAAQRLAPAGITIIDGGSQDGSRELAERHGARFIDLGENRGFAGAVRHGVDVIPANRIAILNNDLRLDPGWLEVMAAVDAPFAVGKVLAWDGPPRIDATWDLISASGIPQRAGQGSPDAAFWNQPRQIALAPWTAIVIRRDYWQQTGGLDQSFESFLEDIDIGLRGYKLGFRGRYEPAALCWHRGSSTFGQWHPQQVRLSARNQLRLIARHGRPDWPRIFIGQALWGLAAARRGCGAAWLRGKYEAWREISSFGTGESTLNDLEAELFAVESITGISRFWRWYWSLSL